MHTANLAYFGVNFLTSKNEVLASLNAMHVLVHLDSLFNFWLNRY